MCKYVLGEEIEKALETLKSFSVQGLCPRTPHQGFAPEPTRWPPVSINIPDVPFDFEHCKVFSY